MYKLRPHQIKFSKEVFAVLSDFNIVYLAGEVRSGKTITSLETANLFCAEKVLFITKKKAISSIESDYNNFGFTYNLTVINYESLHKLKSHVFDLVIYDEAHSCSAYPKPSKRTKLCKKLFSKIPTVLMSGTPAVESYSQFYHQFYLSDYSPFKEYKNFYRWADDFVDKKQMKLPTHTVTDYSHAKVNEINKIIKPYIVKMSQSDANFSVKIKEHIIEIPLPEKLYKLSNKLLKDRVIEGNTGYIFGDAPAKLQSKVHQILNGHCIIEKANGETFNKIFSTYKADFIKQRFKGHQIVVMYYYQNELSILKETFKDEITTDLNEFNTTSKSIAVQQNSSEGLNLSKADFLVYYNLGYSGKNYIQSRDRLTVKQRKSNKIYFICEKNGITSKILKTVSQKKDYNSKVFKKDFVN